MNAITGDLFAMPQRRVETPIARRSDPASSHLAAGEITAFEKLKDPRWQKKRLEALQKSDFHYFF